MRKKRIMLLAISVIILGLLAYFLPLMLTVISGYAAKKSCSCIFLSQRDENAIQETDLDFFPVRYANISLDHKERSVTASVWGLSSQKAIYREGLGCTLVSETTSEELHAQLVPPREPLPSGRDTIPWPMGERLPDTIPDGVNMQALKTAVQAAFDSPGAGFVKKTRAVAVVFKDQLIFEEYAPGFDKDTPLLGWSMTKSITNALTGILVGQGRLSLEQPAGFEEWQNDARREITLNHLLQMSSGLKWWEFYSFVSPATRMLYLKGDMGHYALDRPLGAEPGSFWEYSSGTTNIIHYLIRQTINNQEDYLNFPYRELFDRVSMNSAIIEPDPSGTLVGSSYGWATARDWARFGLLYLNDGIWNGERILPEGWVQYSRTPAPASGGLYGAQFWLKDPAKIPDAPDDLYACQGFQGQRVYIIPSRDLVVVRLGLTDENEFDFNLFLKNILAAF